MLFYQAELHEALDRDRGWNPVLIGTGVREGNNVLIMFLQTITNHLICPAYHCHHIWWDSSKRALHNHFSCLWILSEPFPQAAALQELLQHTIECNFLGTNCSSTCSTGSCSSISSSSGQAFAPVWAPSLWAATSFKPHPPALPWAAEQVSASAWYPMDCRRLPWISPPAAGESPPPPSLTSVPARPLHFLSHFSQLLCPVFYPHTNHLLAQGYHICRLAKRCICSVKEITCLTAC